VLTQGLLSNGEYINQSGKFLPLGGKTGSFHRKKTSIIRTAKTSFSQQLAKITVTIFFPLKIKSGILF